MISAEYDTEKAVVFLKHLAISNKGYEAKELSRTKVKEQLLRIKKLSKTPELRKQLLELEEMLHKTMQREQNILRHQHIEEVAQIGLKHKIEQLELKLAKYLATRKSRMKRITALESRISGDLTKKSKEVSSLRRQVLAIEQLYSRLKAEGGYPKQKLALMKKKIDVLKHKTRKQ